MNPVNSLQNTFAEELYNLPPKVIVMIPRLWDEVNEEERRLLARILGAVKLSLDGVQILVTEKFVLADVLIFSPRFIISFGVAVEPRLDIYEVRNNDGIATLQSESLDQLDEFGKKRLWKALRQMFNN